LFSPASAADNLDFRFGLRGWEGEGFRVETGNLVTSKDREHTGHKALLHRLVTIPPGGGVLRCTAAAFRPDALKPKQDLDIVVLAAGKRVLPKKVRDGFGWRLAATLLPPREGREQEYIWELDSSIGQSVRIVLVDEDDRPGCFVRAGGFQLLGTEEFERADFSRFMVHLAQQHKLTAMVRFDSPHFTALSNAEENFSELRLRNCELLYLTFQEHFRRKGFTLRQPAARLMVAIFDTQAGFEAYLGRTMSPLITGIYHPATNRLVVYDYGQNRSYLSQKHQAERRVRQIHSELNRQHYLETLSRQAQDFRSGANIGTIMHEVAHQLSFNCGLLSRDADVPLWLAEGLACYCESTRDGAWLGIGEPNPERQASLAPSDLHKEVRLTSLRTMVASDTWFRKQAGNDDLLLAYGQSWALFRMLMQEEPRALRAYLNLIHGRQTSERRLADFQQAFGTDLKVLERRYVEHVRRLVREQSASAPR
jgi:hypothetical protein